ncbi:MAG: hypothetical protein JSR59_17605 [Proteobacteria bacterium]|nr:hypothetical protein [Pseudomonadota bacterium]
MRQIALQSFFVFTLRILAAVPLAVLAASCAWGQAQPAQIAVPGHTVEVTPLPPKAFPTPKRLPLEVDTEAAETFVRLGFGLFLPGGKNFQSTEFLTPLLSTEQAAHLVELVPEYRTFRGKAVAEAIRRLSGWVSGVQFGREGAPVVYIELPYWTDQREGPVTVGTGARISDEENAKFVEELRAVFVGQLGAEEFGPDRIRKRLIRIWWHG